MEFQFDPQFVFDSISEDEIAAFDDGDIESMVEAYLPEVERATLANLEYEGDDGSYDNFPYELQYYLQEVTERAENGRYPMRSAGGDIESPQEYFEWITNDLLEEYEYERKALRNFIVATVEEAKKSANAAKRYRLKSWRDYPALSVRTDNITPRRRRQ